MTVNLTDIEKAMLAIASKEGSRIGKEVAAAIQSGELQIPPGSTIYLTLEKFFEYDIPAPMKFVDNWVTSEFYGANNLLCAGGGLVICGKSAINYYHSNNLLAKACYGVSGFCGASAVVAGSVKALSGTCSLSRLAVGSDVLGSSILWVGNHAQRMGDLASQKKNPFSMKEQWAKLNRRTRRPVTPQRGLGRKGLSFTSCAPTDLAVNVPYQEIIIIGGTIFTLYAYFQLLIKVSRYVKRKLSERNHDPKFVYYSARFLIDSYNNTEYMQKFNRISNLALQNDSSLLIISS